MLGSDMRCGCSRCHAHAQPRPQRFVHPLTHGARTLISRQEGHRLERGVGVSCDSVRGRSVSRRQRAQSLVGWDVNGAAGHVFIAAGTAGPHHAHAQDAYGVIRQSWVGGKGAAGAVQALLKDTGYTVVRLLDEGGLSQNTTIALCEKRDAVCAQQVVVKVVRLKQPQDFQNALLELAIMQKIGSSPHVVPLLNVMGGERHMCIVVPYYEQGDLCRRISETNGGHATLPEHTRPVAVTDARRYVTHIIKGLLHLKKHNIAHGYAPQLISHYEKQYDVPRIRDPDARAFVLSILKPDPNDRPTIEMLSRHPFVCGGGEQAGPA